MSEHSERAVQEKALAILKKHRFSVLFNSISDKAKGGNGLRGTRGLSYNGCGTIDIIAASKDGSILPIEVKRSLLIRTKSMLGTYKVSQAARATGQCLFYYFNLATKADSGIKSVILLTGDREGFEETKNVIDMFDLPIELVDMEEFEERLRK